MEEQSGMLFAGAAGDTASQLGHEVGDRMTNDEQRTAPPTERTYRARRAARALLVTPDEHVLLMSMAFPWLDAPIWIAPGGGLKSAESWAEAAVRELREETGFVARTVGEVVWERFLDITHDQKVTRLHERYFVVRTARFDPITLRHEQLERAWFREFCWWPIATLANDDAVEAGAMLQTVIRRSL